MMGRLSLVLSFVLSFYWFINIQLFVYGTDFDDHERNLHQWNSYKVQFNKMYESAEHDQKRMKIYMHNLERIAKHNEHYDKGEVTYKLGVNQFVDMTSEEFEKLYLVSKTGSNFAQHKNLRVISPLLSKAQTIPNHVNWVHEGAVTKIKDQGKCGSCWAFAAVGLLEGHFYLKNKVLEDLSPQNLMDCVRSAHGCEGGTVPKALEYVKENGIATEEEYPYEAKNGTCRYARNEHDSSRTIEKYSQVTPLDEMELKVAVSAGPVQCSMAVSDSGFRFYEYGIYDSKNCSQETTNHTLVIVGYGTTKHTKQDYWLVKNSWGVTWGEQGYMRVARGKNVCAIESDNIYIPRS
ncbi:procathepsin L-like [Planococcus citri]|uniref:procathepsin L-like n=1 Tax=Planococcus citri TaxID=170843 RepID=UPI0031F74057